HRRDGLGLFRLSRLQGHAQCSHAHTGKRIGATRHHGELGLSRLGQNRYGWHPCHAERRTRRIGHRLGRDLTTRRAKQRLLQGWQGDRLVNWWRGHNRGPPLDDPDPPWGTAPIATWFAWRRAHDEVWKSVSYHTMMRRLRSAEAIGLTYEEDALEMLVIGHHLQVLEQEGIAVIGAAGR